MWTGFGLRVQVLKLLSSGEISRMRLGAADHVHVSGTGSVLGKLYPGGYTIFYSMEGNYERH